MAETVLVLDFGSQYTQLIARRIREQKVYSVVHPFDYPVEKIREIIKPCGLSPAKSKNISALSRLLVGKHGGVVPRTFEELEELPGVGHKTASVVRAQIPMVLCSLLQSGPL